MLIVSSFRDYYDSASAFGIDKTVVYQRKTIELKNLKLPKADVPAPYPEEYREQQCHIFKSVIGFCGNFYPLIQVDLPNDSQIFFNADRCIDHLKHLGVGLQEKKVRRYSYYSAHKTFSVRSARNIEAFFDPHLFEPLRELFHEYRTPVLHYGYRVEADNRQRRYLTLNPLLSAYRFARVKDPPTAFQEIYMFISGVLGTPSPPTVEISDKDKQQAKGHDGEYSFKKPPGGGRWR